MKYIKINLFLVVVFLVAMVSCKKETETVNFDLGYNYFPDDSGSYVIYKVDSILYNNFNPNNLKRYSSYYLKEIVEEQFIDNIGRTAKRLERYTTDSIGKPWVLWNVWYIVKTKTNVEKVEDNIRYIKLTFPVIKNNTWRGNKYVDTKPSFINLRYNSSYSFNWTYNITGVNENYSYTDIPSNLSLSSDSTITVLQAADSSFVQKVYSYERYAKNIGLVYKEFWRLDAQINKDSVPQENYENKTVFGFLIKQQAIDFGRE